MNNNQITVNNKDLQKAINEFIKYVKEDESINIDLNQEFISEEKEDRYQELATDFFDAYEHKTIELWDLAKELDLEGYNTLETAIEFNNDNILIVNEVLKNFVLDTIQKHYSN